MKIAVIADGSEKKKIEPLLKAGSKVFANCVYVPVQDVSIEIFREPKLFVSGEQLGHTDCLLPLPSERHEQTFHAITHAFEKETYIPYSHDAFMALSSNVLALSLLKNMNYRTADYRYSFSEKITKNIPFPMEIVISGKAAHVEHGKQLTQLMRFRGTNESIIVKEISESPVTECLVIGNEIVTAMIHKKRTAKTSVNKGFASSISSAVAFLGSEYASVSIQDNKIISLSLSPDFTLFESVCKIRAGEFLMTHLRHKIEENMTVADSIIDALRGYFQ